MFDLISVLKIASKNYFLQKIIFRLSQLDLLPFSLTFTPLSSHSPLFNLAIMGIEPSSPWGKGEEITTKPFLFQMISKN
jgi:hypothetical protein